MSATDERVMILTIALMTYFTALVVVCVLDPCNLARNYENN